MNLQSFEHHLALTTLDSNLVESVNEMIEKLAVPKKLQTTKHVRESVLKGLHIAGWSDEAKLDPTSSITITSVRNSVGLCFQTGNMARLYADLLKLQLLYSRGKITGAIFLVFSKITATALGENMANFGRLTKELAIFIDVITVPILVLGLEVVES
jgi:hypothetical protein